MILRNRQSAKSKRQYLMIITLVSMAIICCAIIVLNIIKDDNRTATSEKHDEYISVLDETIESAKVAFDQKYSDNTKIDEAIEAYKRFESKLSSNEEKSEFYNQLANYITYNCGNECSAKILEITDHAYAINPDRYNLLLVCQTHKTYGDAEKADTYCQEFDEKYPLNENYMDSDPQAL